MRSPIRVRKSSPLMREGRVGVKDRAVLSNFKSHTVAIAKHLMIPEAKNAVPLRLDQTSAFHICRRIMLAAVAFDHDLDPVAGKIGDEVPDWNLSAKSRCRKILAQQTPHRAFSIGKIVPQPSGVSRASDWRAILDHPAGLPGSPLPNPSPSRGGAFSLVRPASPPGSAATLNTSAATPPACPGCGPGPRGSAAGRRACWRGRGGSSGPRAGRS